MEGNRFFRESKLSLASHLRLHRSAFPFQVVASGPGLAFVAYPAVVTRMSGSNLWSFLFFAMLISLALGSIFGAFETVLSAVCDGFPQLRAHKPKMVLLLSAAMFALGLSFTCQGGIHMFTLFNAAAPSWNLLLFTLLEVMES